MGMELECLDKLPLFMKGKTFETPLLSKTGEHKDITTRAIGALWYELFFTLAAGILWIVLFSDINYAIQSIISYAYILVCVYIFLWCVTNKKCKGNFMALFG